MICKENCEMMICLGGKIKQNDKSQQGVDIEIDILVGILRLKVEHLRDDEGGSRVVDLVGEEYDTVVKKS